MTSFRYAKTISIALIFIIFLSFVFSVSPAASGKAESGEENLFARRIELIALEIKSGESMVQIGDRKYIRYSISLNEYKPLIYLDISFDIEFDDSALVLYTTNVHNEQIFAYDAPIDSTRSSQRNIVYYEPMLYGNKISCGAYSTTGMWFHGPVLILYFMPLDESLIGQRYQFRILNFSVTVADTDGSPADMSEYVIGSKDGNITVTEERNFISGDTLPTADDPPFPGRGYGSEETTAKLGVFSVASNKPLQIIIMLIILTLSVAILTAGVKYISHLLKLESMRKKSDGAGDNSDKS